MEFFHGIQHIDFMGKRKFCYFVSGLLIVGSIVSLATRGLNYGIDFTGGIVAQLTYEQPQTIAQLRADIDKTGHADAVIQQFTDTNTFSVRLKTEEEASSATIDNFLSALEAADPGKKFKVEQKTFVGPAVGKHLFKQSIFAVVFSVLAIVVYVAFRFSNPVWGIASIFALAHDVIVALGLISVLRLEVDLVLIAAVLTLGGYSMNDTIVIFDRMREKMRMLRREQLDVVINQSLNETLSRTIITSMTVFSTVAVLFFLGGGVIHDFALVMTLGVITGTYSSLGIAAPMVYDWEMLGRGKPAQQPPAPTLGPNNSKPSGSTPNQPNNRPGRPGQRRRR